MIPTSYNDAEPWNRQPCDTEHRWRAFLAYRDQRPPRTYPGAARALADATTGKPYHMATLALWGQQDAWPERCAAYDRHLDTSRVQVLIDVLAEDARDVARRHIEIAQECQAAARSVAKGWLAKLADGESLEGWSPNETRAMLKDMLMYERLVRGEATERVEHGAADLSALTVEEVETLRLLEAKCGVVE